MIPCKDKFIYSYLTFLILGFSYIDLLLNEINKVLKWQPQSTSFNMMMLKISKNYFVILQEKFKTSWDPSRAVSATLLKKRLNIVVFLKQSVKNMLLFFKQAEEYSILEQ